MTSKFPFLLGKCYILCISLNTWPFELKISTFNNANLVQTKVHISALGRIDLSYCSMYVARTCRTCKIGLLGVVDVLHIILFCIFQDNSDVFEHKNAPHQC